MAPPDDPTLEEALAYLDSHVNFETAPARRMAPTLDRMLELCRLLGDPQLDFPVIHVTGTNGKGSTTRMLSALLGAHGLSVGTYTSPHLERVNERMAWNDEPIDDDTLTEVLLSMAPYEDHLGVRLTHFEVLTATALRWFADNAVDVAVLEVGVGGRWDSTNVADAAVAVVTNVGFDHAEIIGPTLVDIATEKAGIIKPAATVILGETSPELVPIFEARPALAVWHRYEEFGCERNVTALGGRLLDLRTPGGVSSDVFVPLHGPHQGDNAACALAGAEAFFGRKIDDAVVAEAFGGVSVPGRFEVVHRRPFVVLDGAHNPDGARALALTLEEDFAGRVPDIVVVGFTVGRDPGELLDIIGVNKARLVLTCRPRSPRGIDAGVVAAAARQLGANAEAAPDVRTAVERALELATEDEFVLITGSLYVVGDARTVLHHR